MEKLLDKQLQRPVEKKIVSCEEIKMYSFI